MTDAELMDALDGLHAFDYGCHDSGIHDELLRARVKQELLAKEPKVRRRLLAQHVATSCLSEVALEKGYGLEDAHNFLTWLDEDMGLLL